MKTACTTRRTARSLLVVLVTGMVACQFGLSGIVNAWTTTSPQLTVAVVGGSTNDNGKGIVVDSSGNMYITGSFTGTVDFDPGAGTTTLTSTGSGDVYVLKLNSSGDFVWARSVGGAGFDQGWRVAVDNSGNVYLAGIFIGTADFDPGAGTTSLTSVGPGTGSLYDVFALKLNSSGDFVWVKSVGSEGGDALRGLSLDSAGNLILSGYFDGTADFDPGAGTTNLTSTLESGGSPSEDGFVLKLSSSGDFVWARSVGGSLRDVFGGVAVDGSGNIYITGGFKGTVDFDPGAGTTNLTTPMTVPINQFQVAESSQDGFVLKLNSGGEFVWVKQLGGSSSSDVGEALSVHSSGHVYIVGMFQGTVDFDPGPGTTNLTVNNGNQQAGGQDPYVWKLDTSGNFVWARAYGSPSSDVVNAMSVDSSGNVYTTGYFQATGDFDPGAGTAELTPVGTIDAYVVKLSSSGDFAWARHIGGAGQEDGKALSADGSGNVYVIGDFTGTADFDPGAGTTNLTSAGSNDVFVLGLDASGNPNATPNSPTTTTTAAAPTTTAAAPTTTAAAPTTTAAAPTTTAAAPTTTAAAPTTTAAAPSTTNSAATTSTIVDSPPPAVTPSMVESFKPKTLVKEQGVAAGETVTVRISGFQPFELVSVGFDDADAVASQAAGDVISAFADRKVLTTVRADATGTISVQAKLPTSLSGKVTLWAYGRESKVGFQQKFTIGQLPKTGSDGLNASLMVAGSFVALGVVFFALRRRLRGW